MDRLRIAVIGLGWFGEIHCDAFTAIPQAKLAALCTRRPERLAEMGRKYGVSALYTDYRELLKNPEIDAVSIVTAWNQHAEPAIAALDAGKHVFLEKPMAATVEDCVRVSEAAKRSKGHLMVGHVVRFNPRYIAAKREIEAGKIGRIVSLSARRNLPAIWTGEMMNTVGPIIGNLVHDTDLMLWFTGAKAVSVYAQTVSVRGLKYPDIGQVMFRLDSGASATLESVACVPPGTPFDIDERMSIIGTEGSIQIQDTFPGIGIATKEGFRSPDTTYWPLLRGAMQGALPDELAYFVRRMLGNKSPDDVVTVDEAMAATRATLAAEESAVTGKVVRIN
ncbi:MAG: Gfo/Idh/MocA family protein [Alphaproteobacteria bacterium]